MMMKKRRALSPPFLFIWDQPRRIKVRKPSSSGSVSSKVNPAA
ncbi:hypothetical protein MUS_0753 [Bacillus velezensis YAU B9601-Y2]|uniref:Uncharacterized protein n=1 Tax=Bacillus amyloliquefaciens (strain Y2) TaxID=1155777 RepID=I2C2E0_BACAY|nr:hypothetical protein MUS_0753 [Bacillus velezensis YAU B9601-Y2]